MKQADRIQAQHDAIMGQAHEITRLRNLMYEITVRCEDVVHRGRLNGRESDLSVFARDLQALIRRG